MTRPQISFVTNNNNNNSNTCTSPARSSPQAASGTNSNTSSPAHDENDFRASSSPLSSSRKGTPHPAPRSPFHQGNKQATSNNNNNPPPLKLNDNNSKPPASSSSCASNTTSSSQLVVDTTTGSSPKTPSSSSSSKQQPNKKALPTSPSVKTVANFLTLSAKKKRMRDSNSSTTLMVTVSNKQQQQQHEERTTPRKGGRTDDQHSLSSLHRERKEDDSTLFHQRQQQYEQTDNMPTRGATSRPTSESGRARGATPPRPVGHLRSRSNDGLPNNLAAAAADVAAAPTVAQQQQQPQQQPQQQQQVPNSAQPQQQRRSSRRSASPNRIPRVPNKSQHNNNQATTTNSTTDSQTSSPRRFSKTDTTAATTSTASAHNNNNNTTTSSSCHNSVAGSSGGGSLSKRSWPNIINKPADPADHEQALFEQRLCEDAYGVAVRKINQNGKPNLRYVKCIYVEGATFMDPTEAGSTSVGQDSHYYPSSTRSSVSSFTRSFRKSSNTGSPSSHHHHHVVDYHHHHSSSNSSTRLRVLTWGKKKDVRLPLERFVCVRKGKTTERARRNASPSCRILSLITTDPNHQSLDIEAPTRLDRDKFARAFARFLDVPLVGEDKTAQSVSPRDTTAAYHHHYYNSSNKKTTMSEPDLASTPKQAIAEAKRIQQQHNKQVIYPNAPLPVVMANNKNGSSIPRRNSSNSNSAAMKHVLLEGGGSKTATTPSSKQQQALRNSATTSMSHNNNNSNSALSAHSNAHSNPLLAAAAKEQPHQQPYHPQQQQQQQQVQIASLPSSLRDSERSSTQGATASRPTDNQNEDHHHPHHHHHHHNNNNNNEDNASQVSSLTGAGFDQEIVEELHQALTELRAELEESRAEAARAVKVAEQAIQSAENSNSNDWNSTVTHKAAEAAALAQKKSAEAMAKQRLAEERLEGERRTAAFWRRQAEAAEEEAGILQTRAAAAEVQRAAMAEELESERRKTKCRSSRSSSSSMDQHQHQQVGPSMSGDSSSKMSGGRDLVDAHAQSEIALLREKLALESAARRKLLHEVQDLRGVVRVYCRPRECPPGVKAILSIPSQETLLLHPYDDEPPVSFKFDRVFTPDVEQREVYNEIEELCLSVLDGFNICLLAHGQRGSGKTYSILGNVNYTHDNSSTPLIDADIKDQGIHLKTVQQLFSISEHRSERYQDTFTLEIVEVHNERLHDLLAGTEIGETRGHVIMEDSRTRTRRGMSEDGSTAGQPQQSNSHSVSSKQGSTMTKLEIRTNHNGDTVVQGLLSVEVKSYEDVCNLWKQCLSQRASRLAEQGADLGEFEASTHVIATLTVVSINSATGMGSVGKIKFVDLASADLVHRRSGGDQKVCLTPDSSGEKSNSNNDWRYANRSLATLNDVVNCRSQFMRSVPYRNSTLTHLLRDNLEADTKVLLLLCVSAQPKDLQETACALRFASGMRRVTIGKATKHSLCR